MKEYMARPGQSVRPASVLELSRQAALQQQAFIANSAVTGKEMDHKLCLKR
jgi:hypothetical protein